MIISKDGFVNNHFTLERNSVRSKRHKKIYNPTYLNSSKAHKLYLTTKYFKNTLQSLWNVFKEKG